MITQHEEGICDSMCSDFRDVEPENTQNLLEWLEARGYLAYFDIGNAWDSSAKQYKLNWDIVKERLGVYPPPALVPLSPLEMKR